MVLWSKSFPVGRLHDAAEKFPYGARSVAKTANSLVGKIVKIVFKKRS